MPTRAEGSQHDPHDHPRPDRRPGRLGRPCTESKRARNAATWGDKPADITCWTYGTETFSGRSTGKVEHSEEGRIAFVDAANGRYTTVDGDCRVVYLAEGDAAAPAPTTDVAPAQTAADSEVLIARPEKVPAQ